MILGRITAEMIASVPDEVRDVLGLEPGGFVAYEVDGARS